MSWSNVGFIAVFIFWLLGLLIILHKRFIRLEKQNIAFMENNYKLLHENSLLKHQIDILRKNGKFK